MGCKGGCESLQWALQVAMEADPNFAQEVMDDINGYNELERQAMRAAIVADPCLHCILPLYDMLYTDREGELWFFDEEGNLMHNQASGGESGRGVCFDSSYFVSPWHPYTRHSGRSSAKTGCSSRSRTMGIFMGHR